MSETTPTPCAVKECPIWQKPAGCGFLSAGQPCKNPKWRDTWVLRTAPPPECEDCDEDATYHLCKACVQKPYKTIEQLKQRITKLEAELSKAQDD